MLKISMHCINTQLLLVNLCKISHIKDICTSVAYGTAATTYVFYQINATFLIESII